MSYTEKIDRSSEIREIVAKDREGKILKITRECDLAKIYKECTECMNRNGLKRIITPNQMRAPVKPEAAYDRQRWNQAEEGDDKLIKDYEKLDISWDQGCNMVVPAFLRMLPLELYNELALLVDEELTVSTQVNLFHMMGIFFANYGGWTKKKGEANFLALKDVPSFKRIADVLAALTIVKEKRLERDNWDNNVETYNDAWYKDWLTDRMKDWDQLHHLYSVIMEDEDLTFAECQTKILKKMSQLRDSESDANSIASRLAASRITVAGSPLDSSSYQYEISAAAAQNSEETTREGKPKVCWTCKQPGHRAYECPDRARVYEQGGGTTTAFVRITVRVPRAV